MLGSQNIAARTVAASGSTQLPAPLYAWHGVVLTTNGAPATDATVTITNPDGTEARVYDRPNRMRLIQPLKADDRGGVEVYLEPGEYDVTAESNGGSYTLNNVPITGP